MIQNSYVLIAQIFQWNNFESTILKALPIYSQLLPNRVKSMWQSTHVLYHIVRHIEYLVHCTKGYHYKASIKNIKI